MTYLSISVERGDLAIFTGIDKGRCRLGFAGHGDGTVESKTVKDLGATEMDGRAPALEYRIESTIASVLTMRHSLQLSSSRRTAFCQSCESHRSCGACCQRRASDNWIRALSEQLDLLVALTVKYDLSRLQYGIRALSNRFRREALRTICLSAVPMSVLTGRLGDGRLLASLLSVLFGSACGVQPRMPDVSDEHCFEFFG